MVDTFNPNDTKESWLGVSLTESAAKQVNTLVTNDPRLIGLKLSVKKSGCAGFAYDMSLAKETASDDHIYEFFGAKVVVPLEAMPYLDGTVVDYVSEGINKIFKFHNPKATNACGCGESFSAESEVGTI